MNSVMSSRITIAYLLMALKKVTELLLLWSIETTLNVFDYLMQQAFLELNYINAGCAWIDPSMKNRTSLCTRLFDVAIPETTF